MGTILLRHEAGMNWVRETYLACQSSNEPFRTSCLAIVRDDGCAALEPNSQSTSARQQFVFKLAT